MRLGPPRHPRRVADLINPAAALAPAANVIMQLASPGVGYGVLESPVDSGNVYKHPFNPQFAGPLNLFATTGFLPAEFRTLMRLPWSAQRQRVFDALLVALRVTDRVIPREVWLLGYQLYLWDMRARPRRGTRMV